MFVFAAVVLILADVFETFRDVSMTPGKLEIDPAHYVSAPQMAWDAMLKKTGIEPDLIYDPAIYLMIESGMRGGVCMISKRFANPNNKALGPLYDPENPQHSLSIWMLPICMAGQCLRFCL